MSEINDINLPFIKGVTLATGDVARIEGVFERKGNYQKYTANVDLSGIKGQLSLNDTSIGYLVSHWGNDPQGWVGKEIVMSLEDMGQRKNVRIWRPAELAE